MIIFSAIPTERCEVGSKTTERVLWTMQRGGFGASVEKVEEKRKPEHFFGHRKSKHDC